MSSQPSSSSHRLSQAKGGWSTPKADPPPPPAPTKPKKYRVVVEPAKPNLRDHPTPRLKPPTKQFVEVAKHERELLDELRQIDPEVVRGAAVRLRTQRTKKRWQDMSTEERNTY
jgi:hypothetical protein